MAGILRPTCHITTAAILLTAFACGPAHDPPVKPNDEIFTVDPAHLLEIEYKSAQQRIVAHRWTTSEPFIVTFERADGRTFERCRADDRILSSLRRLASIRARKNVPGADAEQASKTPSAWGTLSIRDDANPEPALFLVRAAAPPLARSFGSDVTFELEDGTLSLLSQRCPAVDPR
jgi:hypothetical protein